MKSFLKGFLKAFLIVLLFAVLYVGGMLFAFDFFFEYPRGYLDTAEREANARNYRLVQNIKMDKNSLLYFTRSNNGVGSGMHVGTLDSDWPDFVANLKCTSTSSVYFPINSYGYVKATDEEETCYLFGATSDENTVAVVIRFYPEGEDYKEYNMIYDSQTFYFPGFDESLASLPSRIYGYNETDGITFEYGGEGLKSGTFIAKDAEF